VKKVVLIIAIAGFVAAGSMAIPHKVHADCANLLINCTIFGDPGKTVASTSFSLCFSWKHFECIPCHGGGQWSYLAAWCNSTYEKCGNNCWACEVDRSCCYDPQGNKDCW
jgi:hypothetical protein